MKEPLNGRFDIFIAYYGNSETGSEKSAKRIYDLIHNKEIFPGKKIQAYFHPETNGFGRFEKTPKYVKRTPMFLLVADKGIPRDAYGEIPEYRSDHSASNLYEEIDAFHASPMFKGYTGREKAAKVYVTDDMSLKAAEQLHHIFGGKNVLTSDRELLDWIRDFFLHTNPLRVSTRCKQLLLEDEEEFLRGAWLDEALEIWNTTHDERIARSLIAYYISKIQAGDTSVTKPMANLCKELYRWNNLDPKTKTLLERAAGELKKLVDRRD